MENARCEDCVMKWCCSFYLDEILSYEEQFQQFKERVKWRTKEECYAKKIEVIVDCDGFELNTKPDEQ